MIVVAINYVDYSGFLKKQLQEDAIKTMVDRDNVKYVSFNFKHDNVILPSHFVISKTLMRNSKNTIDNDRNLPYIKEIFDKACENECDIFGYINSDVLLNNNFFDIFSVPFDAYLFSRFDINNSKDFKVVGSEHPGYDGIFFKKDWWIKNRHRFSNNLILGEPAWDDYYFKTIKSYTDKFLIQRRLYHVYHPTIWNVKSNGAKNNINIMYGGSL